MKTAFLIAFRHLGLKHQGSFTSFAGITAIIGLGLGVCALVLTSSVLGGFEETISQKIAGMDGHIRVQHYLYKPINPFKTKLDSVFYNQKTSHSILPYIQEAAMVRKGAKAEGVLIEGVGDDELPKSISNMIQQGSSNMVQGSVIIGEELAQLLNVQIYDKLVLMDMKSMMNLSSGQRLKQVIIGGIYKSGLQEYDKSVVYLSLTDAQELFQYEKKITGYSIRFENGKNVVKIASRIEEELGYPHYVITWKEKHQTLFNWLNLQKWPILIIFGMIALVGVVNIVSSLTMIVMEKTRSIGTLKSMGMNKPTLRNIFLIKGIVIGFLGSVFGLGIALILAFIQIRFKPLSIAEDIYFMKNVPILLDWTFIAIIVFSALVCSVLSSLWPVKRASSVDPVIALRYE